MFVPIWIIIRRYFPWLLLSTDSVRKPPYLNVEVVTKRVFKYGVQFTTWSNKGSFDYLRGRDRKYRESLASLKNIENSDNFP